MAERVADGHVLDADAFAKPRDSHARLDSHAERRLLREIAAMRGMNAPAPDFIRAEQHIVQPLRAVVHAGERDIFEVGSGRGEDDFDILGDRIGRANPPA